MHAALAPWHPSRAACVAICFDLGWSPWRQPLRRLVPGAEMRCPQPLDISQISCSQRSLIACVPVCDAGTQACSPLAGWPRFSLLVSPWLVSTPRLLAFGFESRPVVQSRWSWVFGDGLCACLCRGQPRSDPDGGISLVSSWFWNGLARLSAHPCPPAPSLRSSDPNLLGWPPILDGCCDLG